VRRPSDDPALGNGDLEMARTSLRDRTASVDSMLLRSDSPYIRDVCSAARIRAFRRVGCFNEAFVFKEDGTRGMTADWNRSEVGVYVW